MFCNVNDGYAITVLFVLIEKIRPIPIMHSFIYPNCDSSGRYSREFNAAAVKSPTTVELFWRYGEALTYLLNKVVMFYGQIQR
ncbi:hypothetical protein D3C75_1287670 [compost metagenome]